MRVLMVFSRYRAPGGEERSMLTEAELLRSAGHAVDILSVSSPMTIARDIGAALRQFKPNVVHVQNFFPLLQPRHYHMISESGRPIVQSLRNYRLTCMSANHWRENASCTECSFDDHSPGVIHGCYRTSRPQSLVAAGLLRSHRGTWTSHVSAFIAVSENVRDSAKPWVGNTPVFVKPNTVITDVTGDGSAGDVVYIGRLSPEKGIIELAAAWAADPSLPDLVVLGDGPLRSDLERLADAASNVSYEGQVSHDNALRRMAEAIATVAPWRWDEPFGRSLMESLAVGTPVIASPPAAAKFPDDTGAITKYSPSDQGSFASAIQGIAAEPERRRAAARNYFEKWFTPAAVLDTLVGIYEHVLEIAFRTGPPEG